MWSSVLRLTRERSVRGRMAAQLLSMVLACLAIGLLGVWGVESMRHDMSLALRGNQQLRQLYEAGHWVIEAREALDSGRNQAASEALAAALLQLSPRPQAAEEWLQPAQQQTCRARVQALIKQLETQSPAATAAPLNSLLATFAELSGNVKHAIEQQQQHAAAQHRLVLTLTMLLAGLTTLSAAVFAVRHYHSITRPLQRLAEHARRLAAGNLHERLSLPDREFAQLAGEYNRMAAELERLYREMDQRVDASAQELLRSERLASIGYLAAGVAHEINNPLAIIAGHSERMVRLLDHPLQQPEAARLRQAAQTICDEAFRCKAITERLLSLARPGREGVCMVNLRQMAAEVSADLAILPRYAGRQARLAPASADGAVLANAGEMKQVIINLLANALDATAGSGDVFISVRQESGQVALEVRDTGRGMTPEVLQRVFEPWFSRADDRAGSGLGLALTHAIVKEHHGRIEATSPGPGQGSCFTVWLPAAPQENEHAHQ